VCEPEAEQCLEAGHRGAAEDVPFVVEFRDGGPGVMVTR
jgi:hypothetical protein